MDVVQNRMNKIGKKADMTKDKEVILEVNTLKKCEQALLENIPLRKLEFEEDELNVIKNFNLITLKPIIYAANVSEEDAAANENQYTKLVEEYAQKENSLVITMCAKVESELSELEDEDKKTFLLELGIKESGLDKLITATYKLLGLETFFTAGTDEVRAWTFKKGMKAPECAGIIHTDFQKGFIKAEVMSYEDLVEYNDEKAVKEAGKLRLEGKEYLMKDGDICYFRFNV